MFVEVLLESLYCVLEEHAEMEKMLAATRVISFCLFKLLQATLLPSKVRPLEMNVNYVDTKVEASKFSKVWKYWKYSLLRNINLIVIARLEERNDVELAQKLQYASEKLSSQASLHEKSDKIKFSPRDLEPATVAEETNVEVLNASFSKEGKNNNDDGIIN